MINIMLHNEWMLAIFFYIRAAKSRHCPYLISHLCYIISKTPSILLKEMNIYETKCQKLFNMIYYCEAQHIHI